jgi:hypothetical protein
MSVAIEVPHGPVVDLLLDRSFVDYAIDPIGTKPRDLVEGLRFAKSAFP